MICLLISYVCFKQIETVISELLSSNNAIILKTHSKNKEDRNASGALSIVTMVAQCDLELKFIKSFRYPSMSVDVRHSP